jgi:hypothetical protein
MNKNELRANSPFVPPPRKKKESTMQTVVVNINEEPFDVYIGRAGRGEDGYFGNPFRIGCGISREDAVQKFQKYFTDRIEKDSDFKGRVLALKGKRLGCFCKPKACHGDVIADWLNKMEQKEVE